MPKPLLYADHELVEEILNHKTAAFELVIRRNNPYLYRIGRMYHFSHEDTQDLMQETYIQAFLHLSTFQNKSSLRTWLSKIMLRLCYRKSRSWAAKHIQPAELPEEYDIKTAVPETAHTVMNTELNSVLEHSLLHLPQNYREVFTLREINGYTVAETAQILDISESNVKTSLSRAKGLLRNEILKIYNREEIFEFNIIYCDAMVERVMTEIEKLKV